ncbi:FAD-dependent oxidoreductase [Geminicoccaceae bacterium 1502E]|nr:FAD-dependent oxidoreductase [Geminicoccaceae bacterium 1502E]
MSRPVEFPPSLWAAATPAREPAPALEGAIEADVVVIGGGFSGLSTALELARRGRSVTLLEAQAVGWGASGRNNGQVIPTMSAAEPEAIVARYGETGERFVRLIADSADVLFRLAEAENIDCEAEQTGWFQPAHSPGRIRLSEKRVEAWRRYGAPAELLDREASTRLLGSDFWHGGMFNRTGGHINPLALARGLADACVRRGVVIFERTPVTGYARSGDGWKIETERGSVTASAVVLATNAYTDERVPGLAPRMSRTIVPILSWQMATAPLGDNLRRTILPGRQAVSDTRGDLRFFRYDARNRLITGGAVLGPWRAAERVKEIVAGRMAEAFPEMGRPEISHVWSGRVGITRDRFPHLHRLGPDFWAWTGCNGRGVALSVSLGRELAAVVDGGRIGDLALPVTEPEPIPLHGLVRHVAPAMLAWYRRRDKVEPRLN